MTTQLGGMPPESLVRVLMWQLANDGRSAARNGPGQQS